MRNFTYNTDPLEQNANEILRYHKKRLFKQQVVFTCIFFVLIAIGVLYVYERLVYTYYDGYIKLDQNHIRAIDDIYVLKIDKKTGDWVEKGDTLFSYVLVDNILAQHNVNSIPSFVGDLHKMQVQAELARSEVPVLQTRLQELEKRLKAEENDIYYGLTDNTKKMQLEAERKELQTLLAEQNKRIELYQHLAANQSRYLQNSGYGLNVMPYSPHEKIYKELIKYCCAPNGAIVTDVKVPEETIVFHGEGIVDLQHNDYKASNLGIMTYVPADKVKYIHPDEAVEVIVNNDITLKAKLSLMGIRVETLPKHLMRNFAHDVDVVVAYFTFLPYQTIPFWVLSENLPVRVRVNNFYRGDGENSQLFYIREDNSVVPWNDDTLVVDTLISQPPVAVMPLDTAFVVDTLKELHHDYDTRK